MKRIYKIVLYSFLVVSFVSCKKEMIEKNTNEELLVSTDPKFVFTSATQNWNNSGRGDLMSKYSGVMQLMQYIVSSEGASEGIYANPAIVNNPSPYLPYYNYYYSSYGNKLKYLTEFVIENRVDKETYQHIGAIAKILNTYQAWLVFDTHGAAPYFEANDGINGNTTPKYDMFEDTYKVFDQTVKEQVALLMSGLTAQVNLGNNDFFYRGDEAKWIKFANTLRIKMAQRFEHVDAAHYTAVLEEVLSNEGGIISNNEESCVYFHSIEHNNDTWDTAVLTYQFGASNALVSYLSDNNDPRLPILVRRNGFGEGNNNPANDAVASSLALYFPDYATNPEYAKYAKRYVGMPATPDLSDDPASRESIAFATKDAAGDPVNFTVRGISQIQSRFFVKNGGSAETAGGDRNIDYPRNDNDEMKLFSPQITYAEVCFMMAEIAEKAGTAKGGKDAKTWYEDGIRASLVSYQEWGERMKILAASDATAADYAPITADKIDEYLKQPQVQYTGSSDRKLELIISQAWVNFFMRPEEAWATWKRTGLPKFKSYSAANPKNGIAVFDEIKAGGTEFLIPRRSKLPTPNTANIDHFNEALSKLIAHPEYLEQNQSQGRIFWDK